MAKPTTRRTPRDNNDNDGSSPGGSIEGDFDLSRIEILEIFEEMAHPGLALGCRRLGDRRYQAQR